MGAMLIPTTGAAAAGLAMRAYWGGGLVRVVADSMQLEGQLLANGSANVQGGGGAGGWVYVAVSALAGAGSIEAKGGNSMPG